MNDIFYNIIRQRVIVYINDINVYANIFEEYMGLLREVMKRLQEKQLRIKPTKCHFGMKRIEYLGFIIDEGDIKPDPKKTEIVKKYPTPSDKMTLRAFVGLLQFYKRFIPGFSEIAAPLFMLLRKEKEFIWTNAHQEAFELLKEALINAPVITRIDFNKELTLYTDASKF